MSLHIFQFHQWLLSLAQFHIHPNALLNGLDYNNEESLFRERSYLFLFFIHCTCRIFTYQKMVGTFNKFFLNKILWFLHFYMFYIYLNIFLSIQRYDNVLILLKDHLRRRDTKLHKQTKKENKNVSKLAGKTKFTLFHFVTHSIMKTRVNKPFFKFYFD